MQYVSLQRIMEKFNGILYVALFLWVLSHVYYFRDVKQDLAPQEYNIFKDNIFKDNSEIYLGLDLIKIDIPANTVTDLTGGISEWDHRQLVRLSAPSTAHVISI